MPGSPIGAATGRRFDIDVLLDAARDVFFVDGFTSAQIADIARAAGTTKPTLYARLGSKEQIHRAVVQREADALEANIAAAYDRGSDLPLRQLAEVGMQPLFQLARERPSGFHLLFRGDASSAASGAIRQTVVDHIIDLLTSLIHRRDDLFGSNLGDAAHLVAAACVGLARQVCESALERGEDLDTAERIAARLAENALRHFRP